MIYGAGHKVERGGETDKETPGRNGTRTELQTLSKVSNSMRLEENIKSGSAASFLLYFPLSKSSLRRQRGVN